jgi:hypothetical protein
MWRWHPRRDVDIVELCGGVSGWWKRWCLESKKGSKVMAAKQN